MLTPGSRLGPYEVVSLLGSGGMGEVYRARDTKLGRDVALKILPDAFAADPERLARFEREATTLASLNHPHIAQIHGLEESTSTRALVIELVEGEDLAQRLAHGPLSIEEALPIARQIAEAIEFAHEAGIIHRDLKPANVKLRPDGTVKVLDFGLAKALDVPGSSSPLANSPMITSPAMTRMGVVLGTAAYMAPEQAKGRPVGKRADIWAFGCVLHEMLTGTRTFAGDTLHEVVANILKSDPDWNALPTSTPPGVRRLLARCLERDPKRRLRDIGDARLDLDDTAESAPAGPAVGSVSRWKLAALLAVSTLLGALVMWAGLRSRAEVAPVSTQFEIELAHFGFANFPGSPGPHIAISPDGRNLVFVGVRGGQPQLWIRPLDRFEATPIPGTEGGYAPFFSPDGRWVGFVSQGKLRKVALAGGAPAPLTDVDWAVQGGSWGTDGTILLGGAKLLRTSADGAASQVLQGGVDQTWYRWPTILPGGRAALYTAVVDQQFDIMSIAFETGERKTVVKNATSPIVIDTGYLLYAQQVSRDSGSFFGGLFAVPFDPARAETTGPPFPVLDGVLVRRGGVAEVAVARTGTLVYMSQSLTEDNLVVVDRQGRSRPFVEASAQYGWPRLSPDGRSLAVTIRGANRGLWLYDFARGSRIKLRTTPGEDEWPVWSPDGLRLASTSDERGAISWRLADPAAPEERLVEVGSHVHLRSWSPDGKYLLFDEERLDTLWDIGMVDLESRKVTTLVQTRFIETDGAFSPDGRWLAYASNQTGRSEVFVVPFPALTPRVQVSTNGGRHPIWSRDGRELFFRRNAAVVAAEVSLTPTFSAGPARVLFTGPYRDAYDPLPDGRSFITLSGTDADPSEEPTGVRVVTHWIEDLRRRATDQTRAGSPD